MPAPALRITCSSSACWRSVICGVALSMRRKRIPCLRAWTTSSSPAASSWSACCRQPPRTWRASRLAPKARWRCQPALSEKLYAAICWSRGGQAAVHDEFGPGGECGFVAGKKKDGAGDLDRLRQPPERCRDRKTGREFFRIARRRDHRFEHRRFGERRMHRVAADVVALARAMQRHRFGQQPHAAFAGAVSGEVAVSDQPRDRRYVDDRAAAAILHDADGVLAAEKHAVE